MAVKYEEAHHFTKKRCLYVLVSFAALLLSSYFYGSKASPSPLSDGGKYSVFGCFVLYVLGATWWSVNDLMNIHKIKEKNGYNFLPTDVTFHELKDVLKLGFFCAIAAVLCGMTGIAGGMVLGPLFLSYNMLPQVMSSTNQYITMIASLSVVIQFVMSGQLSKDYALIMGVLAFISGFIGLTAVNNILKKTGKQSPIAIMLTCVLIIALALLPLNFIIKS